jgi:hypothetical protein
MAWVGVKICFKRVFRKSPAQLIFLERLRGFDPHLSDRNLLQGSSPFVGPIWGFCMGCCGSSWWIFDSREHSSAGPRCQVFVGCGFLWVSFDHSLGFRRSLGRAAVFKIYFWGFPSLLGGCVGALAPEFEGVSSWRFVFVGWNPAPDGLPRRVDGFVGFEVERRLG